MQNQKKWEKGKSGKDYGGGTKKIDIKNLKQLRQFFFYYYYFFLPLPSYEKSEMKAFLLSIFTRNFFPIFFFFFFK